MKSPIRTGCIITFKKDYFVGSFKNPKFHGSSILRAEVINHSFGYKNGQHTFTLMILQVIVNGSAKTKIAGEKMLIKGRNLYPNLIDHIQGTDSKKEEL